jgi:hypothetical protein
VQVCAYDAVGGDDEGLVGGGEEDLFGVIIVGLLLSVEWIVNRAYA